MPEHCNINIVPFFPTRQTGLLGCPEGFSSGLDLQQQVPELPALDWLQRIPGQPAPLLEWRVPVPSIQNSFPASLNPVPAKRVQHPTKWIPVPIDCCQQQSRPFPVPPPDWQPTGNRKRFEPSEPESERTCYCPTASDWRRIEERTRQASSPILAVRAASAAVRKERRYSRKLPARRERTSDTPAQQAASRTRFAFDTRRFHKILFHSRPATDPASLDAD